MGRSEPLASLDSVVRAVAEVIGIEPHELGVDDDLFGIGLDSVAMMRLAGRWRRTGVEVSFADLAERPTVAAWWEILSGQEPAAPPAAQPVEVDERAPFALTPVQHAYWVGRGDDQPLGGVGCHAYLEFDGEGVEPGRLEAAVHALVARHLQLRARFPGDGTQVVAEHGAWTGLRVHDLRDLDPAAAKAAAPAVRDRLSHRRLDVAQGQVFDVELTVLPGGATRVHLELDLLVADVLSLQVLCRDLAALYADPAAELPPVGYGFARYLAELAAERAPRVERARAYWQERLPELPGGPQLPLAVDPDEVRRPTFTRRLHRLSPQDTARIVELAAQHDLTPAMVLTTAYAETLAAWSASPRFLLNLPLFDRQDLHPDVPHMVADFTNLVLLDVDLGPTAPATFAGRAREVQARLRANAAHAEYSAVDVLRDLAHLARRGAPERTAPVVLASNIGSELLDDRFRASIGDLHWMISQTPQVWLDHQLYEVDGGLMLTWDAVEELFPAGVLDAMFAAYQRIVQWLVAADGWDRPLPALVPQQQLDVRERVNATASPESGRLLHEGFFAQAAAHPDRTAVAGALSYGELAGAALRLAALLRAEGVETGDAVAVTLPRGPGQVVAVLGILAAGGVYVPVGVDQPAARRERIHAAAGIRVVVDTPLLDRAAGVEPLDGPIAADVEDLAYVIFTSGSTGEPKGVEITHRAAVNTIDDVNRRFGVTEDDRVLAVSALDFDLSVYDVFGLLAVGGAVVVIADDEWRDPDAWLRACAEHGVTVWNSVPALLDMLLVAAAGSLPPSLRLALVSGDWVGLDLPGRLAAAGRCRLVALGGATEAAIWSNFFEVDHVDPAWASIPYGHPLANQRFRVVDELVRDCPDRVAGELWIGGAGVARGYRGDPERTADRFVDGWYRTGDLGRFWPDGTLEFLGRHDQQVKVRGHRIELGEVEAALRAHPDVRQAVAAVTTSGGRAIAAAVTAGPGTDVGAVLAAARDRLPAYMVPDHLHVLAELPLSANGKVDRAAVTRLLDAHAATSGPAAYEPPVGPVETAVAEAWSAELGTGSAGRDADFFLLGGDSLTATRVVARLRAAGFGGVELATLFRTPVLAEFAATISAGTGEQPAAPVLAADPARRHEPFALTEVQRAYWLGRSAGFALGGVGTTYHMELDGERLDVERLERAFHRLIERHEMLRAVVDDDGRQRILPSVPPFRIAVEDAADAAEASARIEHELARPIFDLTTWPLFAARAVHHPAASGPRTRLGITLDYAVFDALSVKLVLAELATLYADPAAELPPVDVSFRDYVEHDTTPSDADREYWSARLAELPPAPRLPLAVDPATITAPRFTRRVLRVPAAQWRRVTDQAKRRRLTPSAVLLSTYAEVLAGFSGGGPLSINLTLFDRKPVHPHIDHVLGDFTSLLLVAHHPAAGEPFAATAHRVQHQLATDLEHRSVSSVWVQRELARRVGQAEAAMPVVFTSTLGMDDDLFDRMPAEFPRLVGGLSQTPQVWLDQQVMQDRGDLVVSFDAVEQLFPAGMLDTIVEAYRRRLDRLAAGEWDAPPPELLPAEQRAVRERVNATAAPESGRRLHDGFFAQAAGRPERTAVAGALSYGELADSALRLAALLRAEGVAAGDAVAVTLPRGATQVVAALGVLAAGGVYVPVGIDQPVVRRERIHAAAGVRVVVDAALLERAAAVEPLEASVAGDVDDLAYVIFTSGSTGEPKGVEITHRAAVNTIDDVNRRFDVTADDRVLAVSALDFDLSVYDVFGLLGAGGALVLVAEQDRREASAWVRACAEHRVTLWNSVPALLDMLLVAAGDALPADLRLAMVSGDWVGLDLPGRLEAASAGRCRLVAMGGATEASIWSNVFEVDEVDPAWTSIPYGRPLANQAFRVVDELGRDCPDWVAGELWIGGTGVARGYRGDPERTADRFVDGWYRTGDLGRYWPDGTLEFLGRRDQQVKVRGHRIELGEIEAALGEHPGIAQARALAPGDRGQRRIVAVVVTSDSDLDVTALPAFLAERLPAYALPAGYTLIDQLPLTANGKVDVAALHALTAAETAAGSDEPASGPAEEAVAGMWAEVLDLATAPGRWDNFFVLGGDSLAATRLVEALRRRYGVELTLRQLFTTPTVAEIAALIDHAFASDIWKEDVV